MSMSIELYLDQNVSLDDWLTHMWRGRITISANRGGVFARFIELSPLANKPYQQANGVRVFVWPKIEKLIIFAEYAQYGIK